MRYFFLLVIAGLLGSCIGDDFIDDRVDETVRIINSVDSLEISTTHQFTAAYFNNIGFQEPATIEWQSTNPAFASIDNDGLATGVAEGNVQIIASVALPTKVVADTVDLAVSPMPVSNQGMERTGMIATTSSYLLTGSFTLREDASNLVLEFADDYAASTALPGLYLYLTNNPNTNNGALEIGEVTIFSGAHSYNIPSNVEINDYDYLLYYCKPFSVKVGDGQIN